MAFTTEGPEKEAVETTIVSMLWLMFVGKKRFLCESPRSHVKLAKDKVEASNFILQGACDLIWPKM